MNMNPRFLTLTGMIVLAAAARLVPHPWNATPVAAMALFAGAHFRRTETALVVPILAMMASDLALGFHGLMFVVYACMAATVLLGRWVTKSFSFARVAGASLVSSILFFGVTNFAVWLSGSLYPVTAAGLQACFVAAVPFFRHTLIGDLAFTAFLFGTFHAAERSFATLQERPVNA